MPFGLKNRRSAVQTMMTTRSQTQSTTAPPVMPNAESDAVEGISQVTQDGGASSGAQPAEHSTTDSRPTRQQDDGLWFLLMGIEFKSAPHYRKIPDFDMAEGRRDYKSPMEPVNGPGCIYYETRMAFERERPDLVEVTNDVYVASDRDYVVACETAWPRLESNVRQAIELKEALESSTGQKDREASVAETTSAEISRADSTSPQQASDKQASSRSSRKRAAPVAAKDEEDGSPGPSGKKAKKISAGAAAGRDWCRQLKQIPLAEVPAFGPPRNQLRGPLLNIDNVQKYSATRGNGISPRKRHPTMTCAEQRFVAAFGEKLSEAQYLECKARIFACHRWRTEEDGLTHNIESSQQVCPIDVKVASVIHRWFDSMKLFNRPWNTADTTQRPANMETLHRITEGRNGRPFPSGGKRMNEPRAVESLPDPVGEED